MAVTHLSGCVQPKQEWLAQMRAGQFDCHSVDEKSVDVEVRGNTARLAGCTITDAAVCGMRALAPAAGLRLRPGRRPVAGASRGRHQLVTGPHHHPNRARRIRTA